MSIEVTWNCAVLADQRWERRWNDMRTNTKKFLKKSKI